MTPSAYSFPLHGPHSGLAVRIAESVAKADYCWIELFHVLPENATDEAETDAEELLGAYVQPLSDEVDVDCRIARADDLAQEIIENTNYHNLTVLGTPEKGKLRRFVFGSTTDTVTAKTRSDPVLVAHRDVRESLLARWF